MEAVAQEAKGKALIVSMVSECGVKKVLELADDARQAGADGVMVSPPFYVPVDQETLKRFIWTIADQSKLPVWLYHQPTHTKVSFEPALVAEFVKHPNIAGLKSSAWKDMLYYHELVRVLRGQSRFRLLMGEDFNNLSGLILYGHGMVSTQSNINPDAFVGLWKAIKAEDLATARKLQDFIMDVEQQLLFRFPNWQGIGKLVLKKKGIFSSINCCEPCPVLTKTQQKEIEKVAKKLGLI